MDVQSCSIPAEQGSRETLSSPDMIGVAKSLVLAYLAAAAAAAGAWAFAIAAT
jgi:hypothetical protein